MLTLLFAIAFVDTPADQPVLPHRPPAVVAAPAATAQPTLPEQPVVTLPPEGGKLTDGPVACNQPLGCGHYPHVAVTIPDGLGYTLETSATWDKGPAATDPEYSAMLDAELCEAKPVYCEG